jgi:hypothetical protein
MNSATMLNTRWISQWEEYVVYARKACELKTVTTGIITALDDVLSVFAILIPAVGAWEVATGNPDQPKAKAEDQARRKICNNVKGPIEREIAKVGTKGLKGKKQSLLGDTWHFLEMMCDIINCRMSSSKEEYRELVPKGGEFMIDFTGLIGGEGYGAVADEKTWDMCQEFSKFIEGGYGAEGKAQIQRVQRAMARDGMRQIQCQYAVCLDEKVKEEGIDIAQCQDDRQYLFCTYVLGEVFQIVPFSGIYDQFATMVQDWFRNPITIASTVSACFCGGCGEIGLGVIDFCSEKGDLGSSWWYDGAAYMTCVFPKTLAKIGDAVISVQAMNKKGEDYWTAGTESCKRARELGLEKPI